MQLILKMDNSKTPLTGKSNSSADLKDHDGNVIGKRYYGPDGRAQKDVDYTDHGIQKDILTFRMNTHGIGLILKNL